MRGKGLHLLVTALALTVLLAVFWIYLQPEFMLQMANQLWACF